MIGELNSGKVRLGQDMSGKICLGNVIEVSSYLVR